MAKYTIIIKPNADKHLAQIYKSGDKSSIQKIETFFLELESHPHEGTGRPEQLKHELSGFWSRRINKKDRLIYDIDESEQIVTLYSAKGHYGE